MPEDTSACVLPLLLALEMTADSRDIVARIKPEFRSEVIAHLESALPNTDEGYDEFAVLAALGLLSDAKPQLFLTAKEVRKRVRERWTAATKKETP